MKYGSMLSADQVTKLVNQYVKDSFMEDMIQAAYRQGYRDRQEELDVLLRVLKDQSSEKKADPSTDVNSIPPDQF